MSLEAKLREVVEAVYGDGLADGELQQAYESDDFDKAVAQIMEAIKEAGYRLHLSDNVVVVPMEGYMTGYEWEKDALARGWRKPFHNTIPK